MAKYRAVTATKKLKHVIQYKISISISQLIKAQTPVVESESILMATEEIFQCSPSTTLVFEGHSSSETRATVNVKNLVNLSILIKVRTTSPHKFNVVPHITIVKPGTTVPLRIILHPFVTRPGRTGTNLDKFLIQVRLL